MKILTTYANPDHAAHRQFYPASPYNTEVFYIPGTEVVRRMTNILTAHHGKDTADVRYIAQVALQQIYRDGSYANAVNLIRTGFASYAWCPEMAR